MAWQRVTKKNPCPICGHDTWCIYIEEICICMRVESERPKLFSSGETGWLHRITERSHPTTNVYERPKMAPAIDCCKLIHGWDRAEDLSKVHELAHALGVSFGALTALSCCWARDYGAWAFPMKDGYENMVGIRLRNVHGDKYAVRGSHAGLFIPMVKPVPTALITEGPTDTSAALDMGYYAVGRPSATSGGPQLKQFVLRHRIRRVVICADNDEVGVRGAQSLCELLPVPCAIVVLPCKDLRQYVTLGGNKQMLDGRIEQCVWKNV